MYIVCTGTGVLWLQSFFLTLFSCRFSASQNRLFSKRKHDIDNSFSNASIAKKEVPVFAEKKRPKKLKKQFAIKHLSLYVIYMHLFLCLISNKHTVLLSNWGLTRKLNNFSGKEQDIPISILDPCEKPTA